jgi:hypothetical protein
MNNAESNLTQSQPRDIQAKTPATETDRADLEVMARGYVGADAPPLSYDGPSGTKIRCHRSVATYGS